MTYHLGIDLGTTYTAAATHEEGRVEVIPLGDRGPSIPSVLYLKPDGSIVAGDAANRHAVTDPERIAREFKRRLGDPTPIQLGGVPTPPEVLTGHLLRWVYDTVVRAKGSAPARTVLTHPANWGPYKRDLLTRAAASAGVPHVTLVTEPQAAAISYASQSRVDPGAVIAVYDLGGGTFDAAVLRKEPDATFTVLGSPEGIERLGGIDFDAAVFAHVCQNLEEIFEELDPEDEQAVAAVARLRQECTQAKEALSLDSEAIIPVLLPNSQTEVRTTRAELENMIRPPLAETVTALERAVRSAGLEPSDVSHVLLVGGSSRIPLVAQMVSAQIGRPVAVDAHPKHAIALGAAIVSAREAGVMVGDAAMQAGAHAARAARPAPPTAAAAARPAPPAPMAAAATSPAPRPAASAAPSPYATTAPAATPTPMSTPYAASAKPAPPPPPAGPAPSPYGAPPPPPPGASSTPPPSPPAGGSSGPGWDPTFDAAHNEAPPPSLGYRSAGAPPPPGASTNLPPGYLDREGKERQKRKEKRKGWAGGLFVALIVVLGLGGALMMMLKQNEKTTLADVRPEECFSFGEDGVNFNDLEIVKCGAPHHGELVAAFDPPAEITDFDSQALKTAQTEPCNLKVEEYYGASRDIAADDGIASFVVTPSEEQWKDGFKETICYAGPAEEGQQINFTIKGKGAQG